LLRVRKGSVPRRGGWLEKVQYQGGGVVRKGSVPRRGGG
tara:strand:+ start:1622 stop:1738 length:117 start_codon:yes stop_codon:yes gene_type:complete